jgi:hypothetical protein
LEQLLNFDFSFSGTKEATIVRKPEKHACMHTENWSRISVNTYVLRAGMTHEIASIF